MVIFIIFLDSFWRSKHNLLICGRNLPAICSIIKGVQQKKSLGRWGILLFFTWEKKRFFPLNNEEEEIMSNAAAYWRENIRLVIGCIIVWFIVSYGFGILFVHQMNKISIAGYELGFWFAQQGSMYIFVVLIFFYASRMNKLDHKYNVHEE